jgi:Thymidylate kinase
MPRLPFITFEGSEGCGKSTQVRRLAEHLKRLGIPHLVTREPGGTPIGESIRELLQFSPHASGMTPETELLLFEASRSQLVREVIQPALEQGSCVISDRFFDSTKWLSASMLLRWAIAGPISRSCWMSIWRRRNRACNKPRAVPIAWNNYHRNFTKKCGAHIGNWPSANRSALF